MSTPHVTDTDLKHLQLISIFHYVVAALMALFACFPLIHLALGAMMLLNPQFLTATPPPGEPPPPEGLSQVMGGFFMLIALCFILSGWAMAVATLIAGRFVAKQKHRTYCIVVASLMSLFMPFGTLLGVFTLVVLLRPGMDALFQPPPTIESLPDSGPAA